MSDTAPGATESGRIFLLPAAGLLLACGLGQETLDQADAAAASLVTYSQHVKPRMDYYCVGCHNPHGPLGNAGGWDFSSYLLVRASFASIEQAALVKKSMPPGGSRRLSAHDAAILRRWRQGSFLEQP